MAEISTEMLVKNLVGCRLNDLSSDINKLIDCVSKFYNSNHSISKRKYTTIVYEVEKACLVLEEILGCRDCKVDKK